MKRLMAEIERQLPRRVWNAVDLSGAMKWRRTVAGRAPFAARDLSGARASRASSPEMTATSSDETADGGDRKTAPKTRLERRSPFEGDEMETHRGRARALRPAVTP
jgi:hypothetical protein